MLLGLYVGRARARLFAPFVSPPLSDSEMPSYCRGCAPSLTVFPVATPRTRSGASGPLTPQQLPAGLVGVPET